ncbi:autotransporter outer membrane beta-barrel domain-containing protein [Escherichia coli]
MSRLSVAIHSLSYSHFNNDLSATMSNGTYVDGSTNSDAWGFGLKAGYDFKLGDAGYVTPYGSISGLFQLVMTTSRATT